jgi:hypothetical protein
MLTGMLVGVASAGPNIFPDPGFESNGDAAAAHTGKKSGILRVGAQTEHFRALGGNLTVEPFATYRATGWAKGSTETGTLYALYSYGWHSYGWGFMTSAPVPKGEAWQKVTTTFVVPANQVTFHPLAASGATNAVACIDDVVVERIKSPEETIAAIEKANSRVPADLQLLARYYLAKGDVERVKKLMSMGDSATKADIACLFAKAATTREERRRWIVDMVRLDCIRYPDAKRRLQELTSDMSDLERLDVSVAALEAAGGSGNAIKSAERIMASGGTGEVLPVQEAEALLAAREEALRGAIAKAKGKPTLEKALAQLQDGLGKEKASLAERRASLGSLQLSIGRKSVTAQTYEIVVPAVPTETESHAARELQFHLESMTGELLDIVKASEAGDRIPIIIGRNELLAKRGQMVDFDALGAEGIVIRTDGPALILAGNRRGVLYAVYSFLEDSCGCRWFTADCQRIPKAGRVRVGRLDTTYVPPFEYRDTDYPNCRPPEFGVRNKLNGLYSRANSEWGGHIKYRGFVHTFRHLVPPETYFEEHPEYYSEIKGVRVGPDRTQLCLTNPDVLRIATETVKRWIKESPDCQIISVSQNDWHNYCQCAKCEALAEKEGSQAGPLLHFVNGIADAGRDENPDVIIDTLAYQYTRKPPKFVKPSPNVAVRLCSIECCFVHPLESCPFNQAFVKDIEGWNAICDRLHIWDYVINYAHTIQPFPNLYVLKPNIQFFRDHGVTGIYEEANYFSKGGELAELRTYVMAKLLWDPTYDTDKAIDEFVDAYYGDAAKYVRRYIDLIHKTVCSKKDQHVRIYSSPSSYLNEPKMLAKAEALFDAAEEAVAGDKALSHRVQVARLPIMYTRIALGGTRFQRQGDALVTGSADASLVDRFETIARAEGVTHIREGQRGWFDNWIQGVKQRSRPVNLLTIRNDQLVAEIIPEMGGRIWSLQDLASGADLLKRFGSEDDGWQPSEGGYEEYSTNGYRSPGWSEDYRVVKQEATAVELECTLANGFVMGRRIELAGDSPALLVTSTLRNASKAVQKVQFRTHPAFGVSNMAKATAFFQQADGTWRRLSLANPADPKAEKEVWLRGGECPVGAWGYFDGEAGIGIRNAFTPAEVDFCYLNYNGDQRRVNLEQWSARRELNPGQSAILHNRYEVIRKLP